MKYVICHGVLLPGQKFDRGRTEIGFYVNNLGELLPQSASVPIVRDRQLPLKTITTLSCPDLQLSPLTQRDWGVLTQALGPYASIPEVYSLPVAKKLSQLVAELDEDELRMITCTGVENAPRQARSEEVLPGIVVDIPAARATERPEDITVHHNARQLEFKRQNSAAAAALFIGQLGQESATLWAVNSLTHAIMTEFAIAQKAAITADAETWVDTIWYAMNVSGGLTTFTDASKYPNFPDFGAEVRARINAINGYLAAWPGCVTQLTQIYSGNNRFEYLWRYLDDPATANAVRDNAQRYRNVLVPALRKATALDAGSLDTWHAYLLALQAMNPGDLAGLRPLVDVDATARWMVECANTWTDFPRTWSIVQGNYGATIAPYLLDAGQRNETLRARIDACLHPTPTVPTYADSMDFAPTGTFTTGPAQVHASTPAIFCPRCARAVQHHSTDLATAERKHQGVRMCAGCQVVINPYEDPAAFACGRCESIAFAHTGCLATVGQ